MMNIRKCCLCAVISAMTSITALTTQVGGAGDREQPGTQEKAPEEVVTLLKKWTAARDAGDGKLIASFLSEDFIAVDPLGGTENKREFIERVSNPAVKIAQMDSSEQSIRIYWPVVVVSGVYRITGKVGERDVSGTYRYVDVARKDGDRWSVIASTITRVMEPPAGSSNQEGRKK